MREYVNYRISLGLLIPTSITSEANFIPTSKFCETMIKKGQYIKTLIKINPINITIKLIN